MILYIKDQNNDSIIKCLNKEELIYNKSSFSVVKKLCKDNLIDYYSYIKILKNKIEFKYNLAIYLNPNLILFNIYSIRNKNNIWINYKELIGCYNENDYFVFLFNNDIRLNIKISLNKIQRLLNICELIINYKNTRYFY